MKDISAAQERALIRGWRWYIVADCLEAAIYRDGPGQAFECVERMANHGGNSDSFANHENAATEFAYRIGQTLELAPEARLFSELVVVGRPCFLGLHQNDPFE